jgi:hypothetical protein
MQVSIGSAARSAEAVSQIEACARILFLQISRPERLRSAGIEFILRFIDADRIDQAIQSLAYPGKVAAPGNAEIQSKRYAVDLCVF